MNCPPPDYIIWNINETEEELLKSLSHPEYFAEKIANLKPGSRRLLEVLAVRRAMKELFYGEEQEVVYDEHGKPSLKAGRPYVSISHTHGYAAVISSDVPVGIDIERIGNRVEKVVSHFLKPEELVTLALYSDTIPSLRSLPSYRKVSPVFLRSLPSCKKVSPVFLRSLPSCRKVSPVFLRSLPSCKKVSPVSLRSLPSSKKVSSLFLHVAWSAKEAAFKILGQEYYDLQHLTTISYVDIAQKTMLLKVKGRRRPLIVHYDFTEDYVLAWVQDDRDK